MSDKTDAESSHRLDSLKWLLVALLVVAGVGGNHYFAAESLLYRVLGLVVLAVVAVFCALQTGKGQLFSDLFKGAKAEVRKVVWPTRQETVQTTFMVVLVVLAMGLLLWGLDTLLGWLVSSLIG